MSLADQMRVPAYLADFHIAALLEARWVNLYIAASGDTAFASKLCLFQWHSGAGGIYRLLCMLTGAVAQSFRELSK